jgi:hypothetical protein
VLCSSRADPSSDDEDDDPTDVRLTWSTYHIGFVWNVWTFCIGRLPAEHRLPRSILEDGAWTHLPHAIDDVEVVLQRHTNQLSQDAPSASHPQRPVEATTHEPNDRRSTVVHLSYGPNGLTLPTNAAELAAFPDTPPMEPREAYTRPARIITQAKAQQVNKPTVGQPQPVEPDTDDEQVESVAL